MSTVQSIERAFQVLESLASDEMGITDLALSVDLPKSTVARIVKTLEEVGAVEKVPSDGRYRVGRAISNMAGAAIASADLITRARPHLAALARDTEEDAGLSVPDGYRMHYIDQVDSDNAIQVRDWSGELIPLHVVPSGLVVLAHWPAERLERFLSRPLPAFTNDTVTDPDRLRERLSQIRSEGHAWVFEEFVEGINSVAAPVLDERGRPIAALHVHGPAYRFPVPTRKTEVAELVMAKAAQLSEQIREHRI